ncbi:hypothetical protein EP47_12325 [Legionella norrlandica]|uniref:Uncharacterized protein n=1 Tax=Legionella norrlandica TaxID=1498499 RepID=A0A0A2SVR3_9GAMM|nr:hypothetical protein [Legionella norrlandica]KGP63811.1 hypothetical protein EP47_12325 [Legionella norrlandica]
MSYKEEIRELQEALSKEDKNTNKNANRLIELIKCLPGGDVKREFIVALTSRALDATKRDETLNELAKCLEQVRLVMQRTYKRRSGSPVTEEEWDRVAGIILLGSSLTTILAPVVFPLAMTLSLVRYANQEERQAQKDAYLLKELKSACIDLGLLPEFKSTIHNFFISHSGKIIGEKLEHSPKSYSVAIYCNNTRI